MEYHQGCVPVATTSGAYLYPVYAAQGHASAQQNIWMSDIPQYQSVAHIGVPQHVGHTYAQQTVMSPNHDVVRESLDARQGYQTYHSGQQMIYSNGCEVDQGQCLSPTVEVDVEELLEYQRRRSSASTEETETLTPAQRRRKAQNRAAQRAFRDRKRQRTHDLEAQLIALESRTTSLEADNENLKRALLLTQNENEVLRSIASSGTTGVNNSATSMDRRRKKVEGSELAQHLPSR